MTTEPFESRQPPRVLLVQCCHLPQFFYVTRRLQEKHPDWIIDALVTDHPQVSFYLDLLSPFHHILSVATITATREACYGRVIFPLLNRGYCRIKRAGRRLHFPACRADYEGNILPLSNLDLLRSCLSPLATATPEFAQYLKAFPHRPLGEKVLFVQSCHPSLIDKTRKQWQELIPPRAEVLWIGEGSARQAWRKVGQQNFDSAVVFFSGEKGFTFLKLLPFLLRLPRILVFNENGHYFYAGPRSLARFLYHRVRFGTALPQACPRILFVQTEAPVYVIQAIQKLKEARLFPRSEVTLLCREEDLPRFQSLPEVDALVTYSRRSLRRNLELLRQLRRLDPDLICGIFSGRPVFRKQKLFFLIFPALRRLVFNAALDCYYLTARTAPRIFRKEPLLLAPDSVAREREDVLFIQTESDPLAVEAVQRLTDPRIAPAAHITVFCRHDKRDLFESLSGVGRVITYRVPGFVWHNLGLIWTLARLKPDATAAILSGREGFRKQKLLFRLLPARRRLIFNEELICFQPIRGWPEGRDSWFGEVPPDWSPLRILWRNTAKIFLFFPRFFYLVIWVTVLKRKRRYSGSQEK